MHNAGEENQLFQNFSAIEKMSFYFIKVSVMNYSRGFLRSCFA